MPSAPSKNLETFPNPQQDRDYIIEIEAPEFTCLCPKTGQPDFATMQLEYVPDRLCVELKSLKLYIWSYRNQGAFHEKVTNTILNDLVAAASPRYMRLRMLFNVRGGIYTTIEAQYRRPGWQEPPAPPGNLPRITQELPAKPGAEAATPSEPPANLRSERFRMLRRARRPPTETAAPENTGAADTQIPSAPKPSRPRRTEELFLGIDLGSTGCRIIAVNGRGEVRARAEAPLPMAIKKESQYTQDPTLWWKAVTASLQHLFGQIDSKNIHTIAVDGTSGTMLLCDAKGTPVTPAIMYNDSRAAEPAERIAAAADEMCGAHGATSSLAKLLWLQERKIHQRARHVLHQADWIAGRLTGSYGHSDYNNCLKLGYDAVNQEWPSWIASLRVKTELLPEVHFPGGEIATVDADIAETFGLLPDTRVVAGTTDGVAAFLAAGASKPGHGVTSLGTTLVLKLLADEPIFASQYGVYSHRLGRYWLAGGASNSGGSVLLQYFKAEQMREMTPLLDPDHPTELDYYPLPGTGERFPVNDPDLAPRLEPLPGDSVTFFQGMLEGIASIEALGYQLLAELGAPKLTALWTTGGGSANAPWERIRKRVLQVEMNKARSGHAAYGAAMLAAGVVNKIFE